MNLILARPRRWFLYCTASLFALLFVSIMLAGLLLMRQGLVVREGVVMGNSMEPHFQGPRWQWTCPLCSEAQQSCVDTTHFAKSIRCTYCEKATLPLSESVASSIEESAVKIEGQRVRIAPLRAVRTMRQKEHDLNPTNRSLHPSGLRRGDVVVLKASSDRPKEIKRLVGFPEEQISIRDGDLFVDGRRWEKTLEESMRQAIVVDSHSEALRLASEDTGDHEARRWSWQRPIFNDLPLNQHDSHRLRVVKDVGIAFQVAQQSNPWKLDLKITTTNSIEDAGSIMASVEVGETGATVRLAKESMEIPTNSATDLDGWIVLVGFDQNWILGDCKREWLRTRRNEPETLVGKLDLLNSVDAQGSLLSRAPLEQSHGTSFQLTCISGKFQVDRLLILRDIMWLGAQDQTEQEWAAGAGFIFLGDNVSSSSDSRDRWEVRPNETIIKGMVMEPKNPIENLLRQTIGF